MHHTLSHYSNSDSIDSFQMEMYKIYHHITSKLHSIECDQFLIRTHAMYNSILTSLLNKKKKKLKNLSKTNDTNQKQTKSKEIQNIVINKSSIELNEKEQRLLNFGLNFALPHKTTPLKNIIMDCEAATSTLKYETAQYTRSKLLNVLSNMEPNFSTSADDLFKTVKSLNEKDIYITKADKGNAVVILDKVEYDNGVHNLINEGPYKRIKNPLNRMTKKVNEAINLNVNTFGIKWKYSVHQTHCKVPLMYALPKVHKVGNKFRPIVSNNQRSTL